METITKIIKRQEFSTNKTGVPVIVKWKGVKMMRAHSIRAVADEIKTMSENQDLISINVIGKQSTGKTELCRTLAHLTHDMSKLPYQVSYFGKNEILDLENTVKHLSPTNHILIFDDLSFLGSQATKKQIDSIQSVLSVIRHLEGGHDVRIILFKIFHYTKAIPPFLRQNDLTFLSSVDDNEEKNLEDLLGKKNSQKIQQLKVLRKSVIKNQPFSFRLGRKHTFEYEPKNPFLPFLYSDGISLRFIVCPLRSWIEPFCQTCTPSKQTPETKQNLEQFTEGFSKCFGKGICKRAIELKLMQAGINTQPKRVLQAMEYIDRFLSQKEINLEELSISYNLTPRETKLFPDKQPQFEKELTV